MRIPNASILLVIALLLLGCTTSGPASGPAGATATPTPTAGLSVTKAVLDANENYSVSLSYDALTRQGRIEAWQYLESDRREQLNFSCVLGSAFMFFINNASIYGESGMVNGTYQVRLPPEKYDQYVDNSGLTREQFADMNVTAVAIDFRDPATNASIGLCEFKWGMEPTIDGQVIPTQKRETAANPTPEVIVETNDKTANGTGGPEATETP